MQFISYFRRNNAILVHHGASRCITVHLGASRCKEKLKKAIKISLVALGAIHKLL